MPKIVPTVAVAGLVAAALMTTSSGQAEILRSAQEMNELSSDWVIGAPVVTPEGERVGSVDGLLLDESEGRVTAAVVSVGGFLGFGAKQIAVDWDELDIRFDGFEVVLPMTADRAEAAPDFAFRERAEPPPPPGAAAPPAATGGMAQ